MEEEIRLKHGDVREEVVRLAGGARSSGRRGRRRWVMLHHHKCKHRKSSESEGSDRDTDGDKVRSPMSPFEVFRIALQRELRRIACNPRRKTTMRLKRVGRVQHVLS